MIGIKHPEDKRDKKHDTDSDQDPQLTASLINAFFLLPVRFFLINSFRFLLLFIRFLHCFCFLICLFFILQCSQRGKCFCYAVFNFRFKIRYDPNLISADFADQMTLFHFISAIRTFHRQLPF